MMLKDKLHWMVGALLALLGVGLVRLVAPRYSPAVTSTVISLLGYTLVISGLLYLTFAARKNG
jgi:uncharacterized membrane protein HdeD (DUF308 family)